MSRSNVRLTCNLRQQPIPHFGETSLPFLSKGAGQGIYESCHAKGVKNVTSFSPQTCANLVCFIWFAETSALPPLQQCPSGADHLCTDSNSAISSNRVGPHFLTAFGEHANCCDATLPSPSRTIPSQRFSAFVNNILKTTQVSDSIIKLSLYYIYSLKVRNSGLHGQLGSEYRLFLTSLILANKFLDDFTYTNKTWSDVSHTPLYEITKMEMQLFSGIGTSANISAENFRHWCATLDVLVKQRDRDFNLLQLRENTPSGAFCSSPPTTAWSSSSSPATPPVLTPHFNPVVLNHHAIGDPTVVAQSSKKRKRCLQSDIIDLKGVYPSRQRLVAPLNAENSVQYISGSTVNQTTSPDLAAPPCLNPDSQNIISTGFLHAGLKSEPVKPHMHSLSGRYTYASKDCMRINGNVDIMCMGAQKSPQMSSDARNVTFGATSSNSMTIPELYWMPNLSPNAFDAEISPTPRKLGYYQLASGYPYGIPAFITMAPFRNVSSSPDQSEQNPISTQMGMHTAPEATQAPHAFTSIPNEFDVLHQLQRCPSLSIHPIKMRSVETTWGT